MKPRLRYSNEGRGGFVVYHDNVSDIKFYFELGGEKCVAIIFIPTAREWSEKTNRGIEDRQPIINFLAEQASRDQAPNSYYVISDSAIEIFEN